MAEFYIEKNERETGDHLVHFSSCKVLPRADSLRYLGSIASFDSAWQEGKKVYHQVSACTECAAKYAIA
ncbi:MAG: hypothetical protein CMK83_26390 [Pseudomonadales bacterium]|jgi:hypothetical protein|uniref:hypothetical protein n=1 Tax=unclassified Ketobacter TaxID=2639109 RepID=UPI000C8E208E|nr:MULTISPECIES: hypothetical protein [unclassified Ketobacter]MAQ22991.1 hypothetical protein [Pseudomonadales bacterium]TNC88907.1 MAG: hypothetical protein CSH49_09365 [Alcanivorax sp.]HAG94409.1 hypothetical protein [Gammaproteobacteria bacterium]MAQ27753.1 hypothetical protein [Pseudomonadales bacterium]MCK5792308.1 hypothetical protein [Ketobacter sp.]|tara:strand:+ start:3476 stop:3682 length:207 start_codon:yes stop_codon:yes gene_type:complete